MKKVLFTFLAIFTMLTAYAQFPGWGPQSKVDGQYLQQDIGCKPAVYNLFTSKL